MRARAVWQGTCAVVRYLGYLLIGLMALAMAFGAAFLLFGNLAERLAVPGNTRLVVFDDVVADGAPVRVRVFLESLDDARPLDGTWLVARMPDRWTEPIGTDGRGLASSSPRGGLAAGRHELPAGYPETRPRLDVLAAGTAWILAHGERVVWIDARAVVRPAAITGSAVRVRPEDMAAAGAAIKTVAEGRQPVYLVAAGAEDYAAIRGALKESDLPAGPAWWVRPGGEAGALAALAKASTGVDAALVCGAELQTAVAACDRKRDARAGGRPG